MIKVVFYKFDGKLIGFCAGGHAFFDIKGKDIVCASVTSAVQLTCNGITECLKDKAAKVYVLDNYINLMLPKDDTINYSSVVFIDSLRLHLDILSQDYSSEIKIEYQEA